VYLRTLREERGVVATGTGFGHIFIDLNQFTSVRSRSRCARFVPAPHWRRPSQSHSRLRLEARLHYNPRLVVCILRVELYLLQPVLTLGGTPITTNNCNFHEQERGWSVVDSLHPIVLAVSPPSLPLRGEEGGDCTTSEVQFTAQGLSTVANATALPGPGAPPWPRHGPWEPPEPPIDGQ